MRTPPRRGLVLAPSPLSAGYRALLDETLGGEPEHLTLGQFRRLGARGMTRAMAGFHGRTVTIALEDPTATAVLPVMHALGVAGFAAVVQVADEEGRLRTLARRRAVTSGARAAGASADGQLRVRRAARELRGLLGDPRKRAAADRRLPILYVNANLWFGVRAGGSVGHVAGVVNGLLAAGREVTVAAPSRPPMVRDGAAFEVLSPPDAFGVPFEANHHRFNARTVGRLSQILASHPHGFIYQRMSVGNYAGVVAARRAGIPLVLEYNGSEAWIARNWGTPLRYDALAVAAEEACLRHAHLVVTVSETLAAELRDRGVEDGRIVTYPNCIDPTIFDPARFPSHQREALRVRLGIPRDATVVTFVGTFGQWHGAEVLASAAAEIADDDAFVDRTRCRFLFVGDGLRMPQVRDAVARGPADVLTTFAGLVPQDEAPAYLAASDILVSPHVPNADGTPFFGSPTKLFEYMAMGKAIVASDLDQIGAVLRPALSLAGTPPPGRADPPVAILTQPGDAGGLARGIRHAAEDPGLRASLGAAARRRALERYTWRHHVDAILGALDGAGVATA